MGGPSINYAPFPTGGGVRLALYSSDTNFVLSRAYSGINGLSAFSTLYSGTTIPLWVDYGDLQAFPLDPEYTYIYELTDSFGSFQTPAIPVSVQLTVEQDQLTAILLRMLQSGIASLELPSNFSRATVTHAMPVNGNPPIPIISLNLDLIQQDSVPIGQEVDSFNSSGNWTITTQVMRQYNITIMTTTPIEREFYRDSVIGIFTAALSEPLKYLGQNVSHDFQAYSSQVVGDQSGLQGIGFYFCEISLEITGLFNINLTSTYSSFLTSGGLVSVPVLPILGVSGIIEETNIMGAPYVTDTFYISGA